MMVLPRVVLVVALVMQVMLVRPGWAEPQTYRLIPDASQVEFFYQLEGQNARGVMPISAADLVIDVENIAASQIAVTLNPGQARAGFVFATQAMKGAQVLDAARHPQIRFRAGRITGSIHGATIAGDVTIRGVRRPIVMRARLYRQRGTAAGDLDRLSVLLTGRLNRHAFGASGFPQMVAPTIELRILARMIRVAGEGAE